MMKKTHIVTGVTLSSVVAGAVGVHITPIFILASAIGSIFPDVDHPSGAINQKVLLVHSWLFKVITYVAMAATLYFYGGKHIDHKVLLCMVPLLIVIGFSRHRSVTHSCICVIAMSGLLTIIKAKYGVDIIIPFCLGVIAHIFVDMFNPQGVELLWPYKKNIGFPITIETGGFGEKVLFYVFIMSTIIVLAKTLKIL